MGYVCNLVLCFVALVSLALVGGDGTLRTVSASPSQVEADRFTTTDLEALQRQLPAGVFPAVARTLQGEGAAAYRVRRRAPGAWVYRAENAAHGMAADFDAEGVRVSLDGAGWSWGITLAGYGRHDAVQAVSEAQLSVDGNRAEYAYAEGITAWYVNGRLGLQQGFTVSRRPAGGSGQGELEVRLSLRGDVVARVDAGGRSATLRQRYAGLYVYDSTGRALPARLASVSGDTIVVGAYGDDDNGINSGSAYVFVKPSGGWSDATRTAKLTASDGAADNHFGRSVSVSGDTIVVGAIDDDDNGNNSGSAYVFVKPSGGWSDATQTAKLTASDGATFDDFGWSVSVSGDTIVVGAIDDDDNGNNSGSAYVFVKSSGGWDDTTETAKLADFGGAADDDFGWSVSVSGDTVVVGAPHDDDNGINSGSAHVYMYA